MPSVEKVTLPARGEVHQGRFTPKCKLATSSSVYEVGEGTGIIGPLEMARAEQGPEQEIHRWEIRALPMAAGRPDVLDLWLGRSLFCVYAPGRGVVSYVECSPPAPVTVPFERKAAGEATSSSQDALGPLLEKLPWGSFQNCSPWGRVKEERRGLALPHPLERRVAIGPSSLSSHL